MVIRQRFIVVVQYLSAEGKLEEYAGENYFERHDYPAKQALRDAIDMCEQVVKNKKCQFGEVTGAYVQRRDWGSDK
jgi:hypothetical protein